MRSRPREQRLQLGALPRGGRREAGPGEGAAGARPGCGGDAAPGPRPASPGSWADCAAEPAGAASQGGAGNGALGAAAAPGPGRERGTNAPLPERGCGEPRPRRGVWDRGGAAGAPGPAGAALSPAGRPGGPSSAFGRVVAVGLFLLFTSLSCLCTYRLEEGIEQSRAQLKWDNS